MKLTAKQIRNLSDAEIESRLNDTRSELMNLRFQLASGQLTDFTQLQQTRRSVARLMTILTERQRVAQGEE
ncbi:MAG: 50S ribosomal protein L29 [Anaerolineales bacterium]